MEALGLIYTQYTTLSGAHGKRWPFSGMFKGNAKVNYTAVVYTQWGAL